MNRFIVNAIHFELNHHENWHICLSARYLSFRKIILKYYPLVKVEEWLSYGNRVNKDDKDAHTHVANLKPPS